MIDSLERRRRTQMLSNCHRLEKTSREGKEMSNLAPMIGVFCRSTIMSRNIYNAAGNVAKASKAIGSALHANIIVR